MARALLLAIAFWWTALAGAQVPVPTLSGRVVDRTSTLSAAQQASLTQTLADFEARKGSQLAVLIVPTTLPEPIEQFALRVAEQWKIGRKKVDDGAILVVAKDDRTLRVEVGYGLEGALNDVTSKRIISEVIVPRFKQQDFAGGIAAGVDQIIRVVDGEPLPAPQERPNLGANDVQQFAPVALILALGLGSILRAWMGRLLARWSRVGWWLGSHGSWRVPCRWPWSPASWRCSSRWLAAWACWRPWAWEAEGTEALVAVVVSGAEAVALAAVARQGDGDEQTLTDRLAPDDHTRACQPSFSCHFHGNH